MGYDDRIGFQFLHPGPGYGGSCFPKDVVGAAAHRPATAGYDFGLLDGVVDVNRGAARRGSSRRSTRGRGRLARRRGRRALGPHVQGRDRRPARLAVARRSPGGCATAARRVRAFDPAAGEQARPVGARARHLRRRVRRRARGPTWLRVLTEWDEFRWLDFARVRDAMRQPHVVDARNLLDPAAMRRIGFAYDGVGRR